MLLALERNSDAGQEGGIFHAQARLFTLEVGYGWLEGSKKAVPYGECLLSEVCLKFSAVAAGSDFLKELEIAFEDDGINLIKEALLGFCVLIILHRYFGCIDGFLLARSC